MAPKQQNQIPAQVADFGFRLVKNLTRKSSEEDHEEHTIPRPVLQARTEQQQQQRSHKTQGGAKSPTSSRWSLMINNAKHSTACGLQITKDAHIEETSVWKGQASGVVRGD